ncbi:MAG: helix-turn-helix domain-containing protein [Alistipes sp.]|nr:helix-turn-helix domain-containing protein [Alistipes sp.]
MTIEELRKIIINNLNILLREHPAITLKSLSQKIGASDSYMHKVMSGLCTPTLEKLISISNYFEIPVTVLLTPHDELSQDIQIISENLKKLPPEALQITKEQVNYMCKTSIKNPDS